MEAQKNTKMRKLKPEKPSEGWNQVPLRYPAACRCNSDRSWDHNGIPWRLF